MTARYEFRPAAQDDLDEQVDYYERESGIELVFRFLDSVNRGISFLLAHPEAGAPRDFGNQRLTGLRCWPVPEFEDIRIYYLAREGSNILIVRILHGKRDLTRLFKETT